ncbi:LVIVD repeat-containing protein [Duganella sp. CF402]|uniref:multiheme c-type cytochrome n=1 Tax=unclassified Duganella TaxID=2636909 RepID=UPI0008CA4C84|nr:MULTISPECIES: multiheme c-type cytochrome [unclassified Duganella]RZT06291.1 LVIVD repeat-containing protein [Duganella sp. BK701]SEM68892.1 LVIVD repeat-containing protein [Duganella sp. CF402]
MKAFKHILALALLLMTAAVVTLVSANSGPALSLREYIMAPAAPAAQTEKQAEAKSSGCLSCHTVTDRHTMHANPGVVLGCTDCHGGNASVVGEGKPESPAYRSALDAAHILPRDEKYWQHPSSANPQGSYAKLNKEHPAYIRFINPGDLRVARDACGACHLPIIQAQERSLMATSAMLWGGASYNNGILPYKRYILGESYTPEGAAAAIVNPLRVDNELFVHKGILDRLYPLPAWETIAPADVFRVFERGGRVIGSAFPEIGLPNSSGTLQKLDEPGRPDIHQSNRGPGTGGRIAVPAINITKTRLNDPHLWFLGTNEQPGDYRSSGCTACHTIYANDRDPLHSGPYASAGNSGMTKTVDPTIPKNQSGHPIKHEFTRAIPSSQCMTCHMHQPNIFVNSFYGYTMWDYESDAPSMWPKKQKYPTDAEIRAIQARNPEEAATRGNWSDPEFLKNVSSLNPTLKDTQFADYHGHGWNFRAIYKRDRKGALLDAKGNIIDDNDPDKFKKTVHLASIHMEKGMQCVDCHFSQDAHSNGHIYGEVAAAIEVDCVDCHGSATKYPTLRTSGPAAKPGGMDMSLLKTQDGRQRFEWREGRLYQRAATDPKKEWEVSLVKDSVNPANPHYNEKAARAKLMSAGPEGQQGKWGPGVGKLAHDNDKMSCHSCHLSWTTSCAGCHLPIQANWKTERLHYEGGESRNYASYNPQVARDDMFQLGVAGPVKGSKITPVRSSSALVLSSVNSNREKIYIQQPPIASSGFSSQAFAPHYPHTERKEETKTCSDCHVSKNNDNNAIMAQLLLQGTNFVNFVGYNAWIGEAGHVEAATVTEWDEPQAVKGSYLQRYAYPDWFEQHKARKMELTETHAHPTEGAANCLQLRGEYLFTAEGKGGLRVYDVASIANKGVSQRIVTAPYSPLGQNTQVPSKYATCMALPTNQPIAPTRNQGDLMRVTNQEQAFHPIYHYAAISDSQEGLILVNVDTLADGEARNNFLNRALTWNPNGLLNGAQHIVLGGHIAYIAADAGMVIVDLNDPLKPRHLATVALDGARASALQFRYLFVTDKSGLRVIDVTLPAKPALLPGRVALADARKVYVARTYAYVAAGKQGLAIIDVEKPAEPKVYQMFDADGQLNDARDIIVGSTNASLFGYVADGANGLKVLQLTAPDTQPRFYGFSPEPKPQLIAWSRTRTPALALSKGLDRDRAVDETGGQIAVFGRIGSRPFNAAEMAKLYLKPDSQIWTVSDQGVPGDYVPRAQKGKK